MHLNNKWKEENKIIQKGSKDHGMAKTKENQSPMKETKIYKLNMAPNFIISINTITSLQEMKVELQEYNFSPK